MVQLCPGCLQGCRLHKLAEKIVLVFGYPQSCEKEEFFLLSAWTFWFVLICVPCLLFIHWIPLRNVWLSILNTLPPSIFTQDKDFPSFLFLGQSCPGALSLLYSRCFSPFTVLIREIRMRSDSCGSLVRENKFLFAKKKERAK